MKARLLTIPVTLTMSEFASGQIVRYNELFRHSADGSGGLPISTMRLPNNIHGKPESALSELAALLAAGSALK